ncbi:metallophosphatase family protein [Sphingomonas cannabina]|uniref:metallophosphoesterase family protein n=1 Tax=Sphingomonas cannabina TaxID=2899123 RepID=UPI001F3F7C17|nr:metallophosphoesterase family protein [Sphingomonas cannabina]UIJ44126.1 metallophosphatase family protein [Sphingomonas cannabina]
MTRTAILSDVHGNLPALEAVIADAEAQGCTRWLNLGDLLSGPLWPAETADLLMSLDWPTIAGNHERQLLTVPPDRMNASDRHARATLTDAHLAWLASLPPTLTADGILLCHGTPSSDVRPLIETIELTGIRRATIEEITARLECVSERLILCGHTHLPATVTLPDGRRAANPGSVGLQAFVDDHPYPYRVENGDPSARYAILGSDGDLDLRAVPYDHAAAAAKAEREGHTDWAMALQTGKVEA